MKHSDRTSHLGPVQKMRIFHDLACSGIVVGNRQLPDPADPTAREKAQRWLDNELAFLSNADRFDLKVVWEKFIDDGRDWYVFDEACKYLGQKYRARLAHA